MLAPVDHDDFDGWVGQLADPQRAGRAYWHLVLCGRTALPAIRRGLGHADAGVRRYCARALDHLADEAAFPHLVQALGDTDAGVRLDAVHTLACDRCKENGCRPAKADVLDPAINLLRSDPHKHVRAMAVELVGRWVHTDAAAERALIEARDGDPEPSVRKKAGWYAPGGPIHAKTASRLPRR